MLMEVKKSSRTRRLRVMERRMEAASTEEDTVALSNFVDKIPGARPGMRSKHG